MTRNAQQRFREAIMRKAACRMSTCTVRQGRRPRPLPPAHVQGQRGRLLRAVLRRPYKLLFITVILGPLLFLLDQAGAQTVPAPVPVDGSYTHGGRTMLYRYDKSPFPKPGASLGNWEPGLLVFLHGNNIGSQEDMLDKFFDHGLAETAWKHGLIPMVLASPGTKFDGDERVERRHWYPEDRVVIDTFLWRGLDDEFSFDPGKVILYGGSNGGIFLDGILRSVSNNAPDTSSFIGSAMKGGVIIWCGATGASGIEPPPAHFGTDFRVLVQATTEDFIYDDVASTFSELRASGWNVLGDLAGPGGHCSPTGPAYSLDEAVGWILGTTHYKVSDGTDTRLGRMSALVPIDPPNFAPDYTDEPIEVRQGTDGSWQVDGEIVATGHEVSRGERKFVIELSDDEDGDEAWRVAAYKISSVGGKNPHSDDVTASLGDGGVATEAQLWDPLGVAVDYSGIVYFSDSGNHRIRRIDPAGVITTIAGKGVAGFAGDGGPATDAFLHSPSGVAVDGSGNVIFSDSGNHRIRRIDAAGVITTIAGRGVAGYGGDGGLATQAYLHSPSGIALDPSKDNVYYVSDSGNQRIRVIDSAGVIRTVAGNGVIGFGGGRWAGDRSRYPESQRDRCCSHWQSVLRRYREPSDPILLLRERRDSDDRDGTHSPGQAASIYRSRDRPLRLDLCFGRQRDSGKECPLLIEAWSERLYGRRRAVRRWDRRGWCVGGCCSIRRGIPCRGSSRTHRFRRSRKRSDSCPRTTRPHIAGMAECRIVMGDRFSQRPIPPE